ncbi:MAG TPA: MFS transporter [Luteolibacter sp.]|nr:MFS transporter [Luteolibacter sp.]
MASDADETIPGEGLRRDLKWRWVILGMLFVSTFLNYFDRQTLSVLKPVIKEEFGLDDRGYSHIVMAFLITYMFAYTLGGRFADKVGSRVAMASFVGLWSLANLFTGLSRSLFQLTACRVVLGVAEPGNYPAALRVAATWFPAKLRGFASSFYQAGSATAAVVAMPLIAFMATHWGWRATFVVPGVIGVFWAIGWWWIYRKPSPEYMPDGGEEIRPVPWRELLRNRNLLGIVLARMTSDQAWYFCLFWMPGYLQENLNLTLVQAGLIGWVPFLCADLGGVASGVASDRMVRKGVEPWRARRKVLMMAAMIAPLAMIVPFTDQLWIVIVAFCALALVCQIWLFNVTTLVADVFPKHTVASVLGVSGSFGALGGLMSNALIGGVVGSLGFMPVFLLMGCVHVIASGLVMALVRGNEKPRR